MKRFIGAFVTDAEELALMDIAYHEGINKSEALRIAIREAAIKRGLWHPSEEELYVIQQRHLKRKRKSVAASQTQ